MFIAQHLDNNNDKNTTYCAFNDESFYVSVIYGVFT